MKKVAILLVLLLLSATVSLAHPPKKITLKLNGQRLSVDVLHESMNIEDHFVKTIVVLLDNEKIIEQHYTFQQPGGQSAVYDIPDLLKDHKTLAVTASCSKFGSRTQTLMLKK
ncbi:MAG: hypothetical protein WCW67_01845 [Candidatus Margulisiibacteriota bacterium]|jgi:hypothetical protein